MAIMYVVQSKKDPANPLADPKYYLIAKAWDHIDRKIFIDDMVRHTSLTFQEAATGIDYLFQSIPRYLRHGLTVRLGEMGYFKTTICSRGVDNPNDATPETIKSIKLKFVPGKAIRDEMNALPIERFPEM